MGVAVSKLTIPCHEDFCDKNGTREYGGFMWCGRHHPPTKEARVLTRQAPVRQRWVESRKTAPEGEPTGRRQRKPPAQKEHHYQATIVGWARANAYRYPPLKFLHSIPNGFFFGWGTGPAERGKLMNKLKAEGLLPGVCDLFLPVPAHGFHGFYLELKAGDGKASVDQWEFIHFVEAMGYKVGLFRDGEDTTEAVIAELENYLAEYDTFKK